MLVALLGWFKESTARAHEESWWSIVSLHWFLEPSKYPNIRINTSYSQLVVCLLHSILRNCLLFVFSNGPYWFSSLTLDESLTELREVQTPHIRRLNYMGANPPSRLPSFLAHFPSHSHCPELFWSHAANWCFGRILMCKKKSDVRESGGVVYRLQRRQTWVQTSALLLVSQVLLEKELNSFELCFTCL